MGTRREYLLTLLAIYEPKLRFPRDATFDDVWAVYKPTLYTQLLDSEQFRNCYAEEFNFEKEAHELPPKPGVVEPERVMLTLREILLHLILDKYKGGALDERIQLEDLTWFGERIDIEMPVADVAALVNPVYWKRVAQAKCKDHLQLTQCELLLKYDWKRLAITSKLIELIETTPKIDWNEEKMNATCRTIAPYVTELEIGQLLSVAQQYLETNAYDKNYQIFNYPPLDCHHGNLGACLGELTNLTKLKITFGVKRLDYEYEKRHFEMSYEDIEKLSAGLALLDKLEDLAIVDSMLDDRKCKILVRGLLTCPLRRLDLSNDRLGDDAGKALAYLLLNQESASLRELELRSNRIGEIGWQAIGYAMQNYTGELDYLGAGNNPMGELGVQSIGAGIIDKPHLLRLDLARAEVEGESGYRLMQIVGFHKRMKWLDMSSICLGKRLGEKLVHHMKDQHQMEHLAVWNCGFTDEQETKLQLLIERNVFYIQNPCMLKEPITPEDAQEIDEWAVKIKHPILLKVIANNPPWDPIIDNGPTPKFKFSQIPKFVPKKQRKIALNSQVLNTYYTDCFGPDSEMTPYDPEKHTERTEEGFNLSDEEDFEYDPNYFTETQFTQSVVMGTRAGLLDKQYFNE